MGQPRGSVLRYVRWPGSDGLRVPQEMAPASLEVYKEYDITATTGTVAFTQKQAGASLITATPTANMIITFPGCQPGKHTTIMNLASATYSITCEIAGNTSNTAVVAANTNAVVVLVPGLISVWPWWLQA